MEMTSSAKYESWNTEDFDGKTAFMFRKVAMSIGTHYRSMCCMCIFVYVLRL